MTLQLAALGLTLTGRATAHELDVATAQVTLRDGHVAVTARVDFLAYMHATYDATEPPIGLVAVADPDAFATLAQTACRDLGNAVDLRMDGTSMETEDWSCPATERLQAIAQREWMAQTVQDHIHPTLTPVTFDVRLDRPPTRLALSFPAAVGPVLVSFVQPVGQLSTPGNAVQLDVHSWSITAAPASPLPSPDVAP